jgi:hypothetical protein
MAITRDDLITKLLALPRILEGRRDAVLEAELEVLEAKADLREKEWDLLQVMVSDDKPLIDGKNEAVRAHQLRELSRPQLKDLHEAEMNLDNMRLHLKVREDEFAALRAVARLFMGHEPL